MIAGEGGFTNVTESILPILPQIREGVPNAGRDLVGRYGSAVHAAIARTLGVSRVAEDAAQDAFLSLFRHAAGSAALPATADDEVRYVWAVAVNAARKAAKREGRHLTAPHDAPETADGHPTPPQLAESAEVRTILEQVEGNFRSVLELFYFRGQSYREIARALEIPEGTVKSRLSRGIDRVRSLFETQGRSR